MGDVKKDVEAMNRIKATGANKLDILCDIDDFIIATFTERIRRKNKNINRNELIKILREELHHGRRDSS